ncbi:MAG: hypothetical protein RLY57_297 [Candidatus Parcubacteria bacterium]
MAVAGAPAIPEVEIAEENGPSLAEKFKEKLKDAGTWLQSRWEKITTVAKEWKDDVVDTIKLNTVDKWKAVTTLDANNSLISKREREIARAEAAEKSLNQERTEVQNNAQREMGLFDTKIAQYTDPDLVEVLNRGKLDKKAVFDKKDGELGAKINASSEKRARAEGAIGRFKENIAEAKNSFAARIDGKIEKIEGKYDYASKIENRSILEQSIKDITSGVEDAEGKLAQYKDALATFKDKGVADGIKEKMKVMESKLAGLKKTATKLQNAKTKLDNKIQKIERKTGKYKDMKAKYGLVPTETSPIETSEEVHTETSEVPGVESSQLDSAEPVVEAFDLKVETIEAIEKRITDLIANRNIDPAQVEKEVIGATLIDLDHVREDSVGAGLIWETYQDFLHMRDKKMFTLDRATLKIYKEALANLATYKKSKSL